MPRPLLYKTMLILFLLAAVFNADRIILEKNAALRKQDVADQYVTKFERCGAFWKAPADHLWDSSILRGWPTYLGSVQPQHLGCFISSVLPVHRTFPILQIIIESLLLIGAFLFLHCFLGYRYLTAFYGTLFYLAMYYWWNENPFVTQTAFLPLIVAAASVGVRAIPRWVRFVFLWLVLFLSYPPYTVALLPVCHLSIIWFFSDRKKLFLNIKNMLLFWAIFSIFYFPNLMGYLMQWGHSNRVLWEPKTEVHGGWPALLLLAGHMGFLFPCFSMVGVARPLKDKRVLVILGLIIGILVLGSQSQVLNLNPFFRMLSFMYVRTYYYISFLLLLLVTYLIEKDSFKWSVRNLIGVAVCICIGVWLLSFANSTKIMVAFVVLSVLSVGFVMFNVLGRVKAACAVFVLAFLFLAPFKAVGLKHYEQVPYGFLYQDPFEYQSVLKPYRVISLLNECVPHTVYPAQVGIKGVETLDGNSVFYSKSDTAYWQKYVLANFDECIFKTWNNRMALTDGIWDSNPDNILKWLRLNNTALIKSQFELDHPGIMFQRKADVPYSPIKSYITREAPTYRTYYLYRIKNAFSRVFSIDRRVIRNRDGQVRDEEFLFKSLNTLPVRNISMDSYRPGVFSWSGAFDSEDIFVSTNYDKNWSLFVDGIEKKNSIRKGPFGMLMLSPDKGEHVYTLRFNDHSHVYMILAMVLGVSGLFIFTRSLAKVEGDINGG